MKKERRKNGEKGQKIDSMATGKDIPKDEPFVAWN